MANTIRAAKNTFGGGLVMDLSPDNTPNEVLTSALNATLVTFNGNELLLQNDMGNGRVETARLPEGYIPVGTCEFGGIIYIVSYNPLTNRSQVGCFPSPERNISTEEIGGTGQQLTADDFLEIKNGTVTGKLVASSVKKILYNNKLYPGDKFVIYDKGDHITSNMNNITDVGNITHQYGTFPKLLRIHVIAIEDSGKINYLDSTLRWYNGKLNGQLKPADYFINKTSLGNSDIVDIDSYRNLLSSGYSVFQSKISGKLALLIELEKITGFSCSYNIYGLKETTGDDNIIKKAYKVYWNVSWETDDPNINPKYVVLTKSKWSGKDSSKAGRWYKWVLDGDKGYKLDNITTQNTVPGIMMPALPENYNDNNYGGNYKYWNVDTQCILRNYTNNSWVTVDISDRSTYENFISYEKALDVFLKDLYHNYPFYEDIALTKLNLEKKSLQFQGDDYILPELGKYYINATKLEYDDNEKVLYTQLSNDGKLLQISPVEIPDFIVNNYFHQPIYLDDDYIFDIPIKLVITDQENNIIGELTPDISNLIYNYELTPAMSYGLLSEYAIEGYIDFSKIGTGFINLTAWRYFVGENAFTLTLGLDAYIEDNMGIEEVVLEFYDNQSELAAAYHLGNKESYSGQFTEVIPLNGSANTYKLLDIDSLGGQHHHLGNIASAGDAPVYKSDNGVIREANWDSNETLYLNDCGTIYSNMLYLVKIVVKYCPLNALGEYDSTTTSNYKYFYRWLWTIPMYNLYYHNTADFDILPLALTLDVLPLYSTTPNYYYDKFVYNSNNTKVVENASNLYQYLSSTVLIVTSSEDVDFEKLQEEEGGGNSGTVDPLQLFINLTILNNSERDIVINGENAIFVGDQRIYLNVRGRTSSCANYFIASGMSMSFAYNQLEYKAIGATNSAIYDLDNKPYSLINKPEVYTFIRSSSSSVNDVFTTEIMSGNFNVGSIDNVANCTIVVTDAKNADINKCVEFLYQDPSFTIDGVTITFPGNTILSIDFSKIHIGYQALTSEGENEGNSIVLVGQTLELPVSGANYTVIGLNTQTLKFLLDSTLASHNNGSYSLFINFEEGAIITDHGKSSMIPGGTGGVITHTFVNGNSKLL